ncbi:hypothetical protein A2803_01265 [Candidatus Woesebacteria bacterium RIFCSPHIGHO2_01_FULL_44_21]|uniref:Uncharacterized protein n=1 Tax=Candidatus Woesebacteria bacterium RIFCSPHIGHO2_01_FULL_44_21 TaxID=1802503 RepID=A0A1F7YZF8_9BACT|nr:MAG: hypothetical protein A2803_01265 [Candidatus Woesebacteria bacterium RIFCSPHIGHO2_01_FULL_44_21]OGM70821.1 MAG: hypothetical protein A2897_05255 [Candidatus Woesebacteria bacterium RIFCSPLOWO2_01_FULL_44_24b]
MSISLTLANLWARFQKATGPAPEMETGRGVTGVRGLVPSLLRNKTVAKQLQNLKPFKGQSKA